MKFVGRTQEVEKLQIAMRDFDVFSGYALERYFHWTFFAKHPAKRVLKRTLGLLSLDDM